MYAVTVTAPNFNGDSASGLVVPSNGTTTKDFALVPLPGTLQGVVTSTNPAGTAIGGATVKLSGGTSVTTDTAGTYTFSSLAPGIYALTVTATNFSSGSASGLAVSSNATTTQNFALTPQPGTLSGTVTDAITKAAIASAKVQITNGPSTTTDNGGNYSFVLPPGTYDLSVNATNYAGATATGVAVVSNATTTKSFALTPLPGALQGIVTSTSPAGTPIAGATVKLAGGASVTTDATGAYKFTSLAPGMYAVTVTATNFSSGSASGLMVASNGTATQNFALTPLPGTLQGVVTSTNPAGSPVAGATIKLGDGTSVTTDAGGFYKFTSLPPGTYQVTVTAAEYNILTVAGIVVGSNAVTTRNFSIAPLTSDLAMVASGPASATAGTSVTYTFTTTNLGVTAASGVVVKHVMPAQTTFTSVGAPAGWTCTKPAAGGNGTVSCAKSSMAVNESAAISVTVVVACPFPAATMTMAATATTPTLETSSSNNSASIVAAVSTPAPTITGASVDKSTLWPPNHKMVDVKVNYTLTGVSCVGARTTLSIASNEGDAEDYEVVDPHHIRLRSEREGNGSGRTYTITISATNDSKVFDRKTVVVTVDHDQGHGK
ncbi:MAG: hypothetical protein AUI36_40385 [Cyanobacteria bacterium 13_1_40CM_2_61_4]|nr:MAG: hypothetical protein AUI36_40385 [Cyanobacteria bacterium 13_1_40CM_2_61_4]